MDKDGQVIEEEGMESLEDRSKRQEMESEQGYFLQPLYVQKTVNKIYLYDSLVTTMRNEFRDRLKTKRDTIQRMKYKCREMSLKDVAILCKKCHQEVALLKTVKYVNDELHHAKCAFGMLRRVEIE